MNMVEKVARAIDEKCAAYFKKPTVYDNAPELIPDLEYVARAAIEAMRETTPNMQNEYYSIRKKTGDAHSACVLNVSYWETAIDAALKE